jgi:hypothetical protein
MKDVVDLALRTGSGEARLMRYESCETTIPSALASRFFLNSYTVASVMLGSFHWLGVLVNS